MAWILAVDDSTELLDLLRAFLATEDHVLVTATSGQRALEYLDRARFDVVIVDVNMPNMSGLELVKRIKSHSQHQLLPILFLSGDNTYSDIKQAIAAGGDDYIIKPPVKKVLIEKLQALTKPKR